MQSIIMRITLFTTLIFMLFISAVYAATEQRMALVIGNSAYSSGPLKNPVNDAADMAAMLKKLGFTVTLKKDAKQQEMDEAIEAFGNSLKRGGVGLFYYAGHGVQVNGTNYLVPIGARINKEADVKYQAVDANRILDEMASANNGLNIVMLDACRDNPYARSFRHATRGLAIVSSAPSGTFISYSTSPGNVARDGDGRNSPYTKAVLENIAKPGLTIADVFMNVRTKVKRETGQVPWESSSLEGRFYFTEQGSRENNVFDIPSSATKSESDFDNEAILRQKEALERERQELVRQKEELEQQKSLAAERERFAEERRKWEAEKQKLSMAPYPSVSTQPVPDQQQLCDVLIHYVDKWTRLSRSVADVKGQLIARFDNQEKVLAEFSGSVDYGVEVSRSIKMKPGSLVILVKYSATSLGTGQPYTPRSTIENSIIISENSRLKASTVHYLGFYTSLKIEKL